MLAKGMFSIQVGIFPSAGSEADKPREGRARRAATSEANEPRKGRQIASSAFLQAAAAPAPSTNSRNPTAATAPTAPSTRRGRANHHSRFF